VGLAEPRNPTYSDRQASDRHRAAEQPSPPPVQCVLPVVIGVEAGERIVHWQALPQQVRYSADRSTLRSPI